MKTLADVCSSLTAGLEQAGKATEAMTTELRRFEEAAAYQSLTWIELRLQILSAMVDAEATQQLLDHGGKGVPCIMSEHDGRLFVAWHEDEPILTEANTSWQARITTLPQAQFLAFMKQLLQQLQGGDWEPAVKWLQAHGKSVVPLKPI